MGLFGARFDRIGEIAQALAVDVFQLFECRCEIGLLLFQFLDEGVRTLGDKSNLLRAAFAPVAIEIEEL